MKETDAKIYFEVKNGEVCEMHIEGTGLNLVALLCTAMTEYEDFSEVVELALDFMKSKDTNNISLK